MAETDQQQSICGQSGHVGQEVRDGEFAGQVARGGESCDGAIESCVEFCQWRWEWI